MTAAWNFYDLYTHCIYIYIFNSLSNSKVQTTGSLLVF